MSSATSGCLAAAQPAEAVVVPAVLVDRADDRQAERLAELVVLRAGAGGDVDDARCPRPRRPRPQARRGARRRVGRPGALREGGLDRRRGRRTARRSASRPGPARRLLLDLERAHQRALERCPCRPRSARRPAGPGRRSLGPHRRATLAASVQGVVVQTSSDSPGRSTSGKRTVRPGPRGPGSPRSSRAG